jgi:hypothetical protein
MNTYNSHTIEAIKKAVLRGESHFNGTPLLKVQTAGTYTQKMAHATQISIRTYKQIYSI